MKKKFKSLAWRRYRLGTDIEVNCFGREPFEVPNTSHRERLLRVGVFELLPDGRLRYIAPYSYRDSDGRKAQVDRDGYVEIDLDKLNPDLAAKMRNELRED